jgi:general secretion pathway protein H
MTRKAEKGSIVMRRTGKVARDQGFSLIEILVALGIFALGAGLAAVNISTLATTLERKSFPEKIENLLEHARQSAEASGQMTRVTISINDRKLNVLGSDNQLILPVDYNLAFIGATSRIGSEQAVAIDFFPDGTASGGSLIVSDTSGKTEFRISWITSAIERRSI